MGCYVSYQGTYGTNSGYRTCGGQQVYCDGDCCRCSRAEVLYSTMNQTSNVAGIHIVQKP